MELHTAALQISSRDKRLKCIIHQAFFLLRMRVVSERTLLEAQEEPVCMHGPTDTTAKFSGSERMQTHSGIYIGTSTRRIILDSVTRKSEVLQHHSCRRTWNSKLLRWFQICQGDKDQGESQAQLMNSHS
ncbi:unnamed protein product [Natator depressus]